MTAVLDSLKTAFGSVGVPQEERDYLARAYNGRAVIVDINRLRPHATEFFEWLGEHGIVKPLVKNLSEYGDDLRIYFFMTENDAFHFKMRWL